MCQHDFRLMADGEVSCIRCFARDDEMELPGEENRSQRDDTVAPDFWATQVNFEE